jgi:hypothetical protein
MEDSAMKVLVEKKDRICTVIINRPESRNAVDRETAAQLVEGSRILNVIASYLWLYCMVQGETFAPGQI